MTKKEIVKQISEELNLTQLKTKEIVQMTFESIIEALVKEGRIELRNFGVFEVKKRAARKARNPRTGERVDVAEKNVVVFKPGKEMEERVLEYGSKEHKTPERGQQDVGQPKSPQDRTQQRANNQTPVAEATSSNSFDQAAPSIPAGPVTTNPLGSPSSP